MRTLAFALLAWMVVGLVGCRGVEPDPATYPLIPFPSELEVEGDPFYVDGDTRVVLIPSDDGELRGVVDLLMEKDCWVIRGNHDARALRHPWPHERELVEPFFSRLRDFMEMIVEGLDVYVVHASPPDSRINGIDLVNSRGKVIPGKKAYWEARLQPFHCDVLIVGHTHRPFAETLGDTLVVNPGSTCFNHTCATLTLPEREVRFFPLDG